MWPSANGEAERFMRTAVASGTPWKHLMISLIHVEIYVNDFMIGYHNSIKDIQKCFLFRDIIVSFNNIINSN